MFLIDLIKIFQRRLLILLIFGVIILPVKILIIPYLIIDKLILDRKETYKIKSKKRSKESLKKIY